jgi:Ran GTPase-activating protein (RanGAP) involved in mRNA processing and transport
MGRHWLATLRKAIRSGPSERSWREVCEALDACPNDEALSRAMHMAMKHVDPWPKEIRVAPAKWWSEIARGGSDQRWDLVRGIELPEGSGLRAVKEVAESPAARQIVRLSIRGALAEDEALEVLSSSPRLEQLEVLDLSKNRLSPKGVHALLHRTWPKLRRIDLSDNPIGASSVEGLVQTNRLPALRALRVRGVGLGPEGASRLASCSEAARLTELDLADNAIGEAGTEAIASSSWLDGLTALGLSKNGIGDRGVRSLAARRSMIAVLELDLSDNALGEMAARMLFNAGPWPELTALDLSDNVLGPDAASMLITSQRTPELRHARFGGTALGPDGVERVAHSERMHALVELSLRDCGIGSSGAIAIARSPCPRLRVLDLAGNEIDDEAALTFASERLRRLQRLDLRRNAVSFATLALIRAMLSRAEVFA